MSPRANSRAKKGPLRLATRGSPLALAQANEVAAALKASQPRLDVELVIVESEGDRRSDVALSVLAGQGVFVKEVQRALQDGRADVAVHSAKDLPTSTPPTLVIASVPPRGDPRDALVGAPLHALAEGASVGTGAGRRRSQLASRRPDLRFVEVRGNMARRLEWLREGEVDALVVARVALDRLGWPGIEASVFSIDEMVPQVGQGALALEARRDDDATKALLAQVSDPLSASCLSAERAFLHALGGDCLAPIGCHASMVKRRLVVRAVVAAPDGSVLVRRDASGTLREARRIGERLAEQVIAGPGGALVATASL